MTDMYDEFDDPVECWWCEDTFERDDLKETNLGLMCERCIEAIRSRGEKVVVYEGGK